VSFAAKAFDESGKLTSELFSKDLDTYLVQYRDWLTRVKRAQG
jgi:hypothetical protein